MQIGQNRRDFITLLGGAVAWPLAARAQQKRIPRLCFLTFDPGTLRTRSPRFDGFFQGLQDLGYVNARNIENGDRFPALIDECLSLKPDVIAVTTTPGGAPFEEGNPRHPHCYGSSGRPSRDRAGR
jgi:putative ABC transport system substrate-binding protein